MDSLYKICFFFSPQAFECGFLYEQTRSDLKLNKFAMQRLGSSQVIVEKGTSLKFLFYRGQVFFIGDKFL